jgi:putative exosortase-associated protein (TIGR04073 family)
MKQTSHTWLAVIFATLLLTASSIAQADDPESYGSNVGNKALHGFANMTTAVVEFPKNIINVSRQSNYMWGFVGGTLKGLVHTLGRIFAGTADLITAPIPTEPLVQPTFVWNDFDAETTYGEFFRLREE